MQNPLNTTPSTPEYKPDILIDTLRISGFRGIDNLEIDFAPMTVLIGANNSGKTTILKALGLALGDYGRYVTEEDFHLGVDDKGNETKANEIIVDVRIISLENNGQRANIFNNNWLVEFGDKIQAEADGKQYVAIRTKIFENVVKGGYQTQRNTMAKWPELSKWLTASGKLTKMSLKIESIPFFSIEAQRDIHSELKDKYSFVGKVLSGVKYDKNVIAELEKTIKEINKEAVDKSKELQRLREHLTKLNRTFRGSGNVEITPFPKKVRDLSKKFSVHFGEAKQNTFAIEYHGMGTRSWASMLTVMAFMDTLRLKYEENVKPFFPILAAEEPESHLHPDAQKTLYHQLKSTKAQVIVSTHSPYLTAMPDIAYVRSLKKTQHGIVAKKLDSHVSSNEKKKLAREILARHGEILFSRALILCEGLTEEQIIPSMFEIFSGGKPLFDLGISCIGVGGKKNYPAFVKLACSFGIFVYIISDNDGSTKIEVEKQIERLRDKGLPLEEHSFGISYCGDGNDFEAELLCTLKIKDEIKNALISCETDDMANDEYKTNKTTEIQSLSNPDILKKMKKAKTAYSGFLADTIREKANDKKQEEWIIQAALDAFKAITSRI